MIATENPVEFEGTFPLPEAQKDRFFLSLRMGYPPDEACRVIADEADGWLRAGGSLDEIRLVAFNRAAADHFRTALRTQGSGGRRAAPPAHGTDL
jgi:MoxR-like ATPase